MRTLFLFIAFTFCYVGSYCFGQELEKEPVLIDDIQVDVKEVSLSAAGDTAMVELFLISYTKGGREFKFNSFASGIVDSQGNPYLYDSMQMGKVLVKSSERQNYIHYLLDEDEPVKLLVKTGGWKKQWGVPRQFKLVFEDSGEPGKFLEVIIDL